MYLRFVQIGFDLEQRVKIWLFSAIIPAGVVNITHICNQVKAAVDAEQKKILWVPASN